MDNYRRGLNTARAIKIAPTTNIAVLPKAIEISAIPVRRSGLLSNVILEAIKECILVSLYSSGPDKSG